jgi:hypothetical protein
MEFFSINTLQSDLEHVEGQNDILRDIHIGSGEHIEVSIFTREKQFGTPESDLGHHRLIIGHDLVTCTLMHKVCKSLTPHGTCRRLVRIFNQDRQLFGVAGAHTARMMHSCLGARQLQF